MNSSGNQKTLLNELDLLFTFRFYLSWLGLCFHYNVIFTIDSNELVVSQWLFLISFHLVSSRTNGVQWFMCVSLALNHKYAEMFNIHLLVFNSIRWQHSEPLRLQYATKQTIYAECLCDTQQCTFLHAVTFLHRRQLFLWTTRKTSKWHLKTSIKDFIKHFTVKFNESHKMWYS